ncbi:MAG: exo-beta-N-acetylmuramidase NamZ domain-containing protein [Bacteroidia bacterium]
MSRNTSQKLVLGADQTNNYIPLLKGKRVGIIANPTSVVNNIHLVDTLLSLHVNVGCVFAPEHGFRGEAEAGETVVAGIDSKTGVKVFSLYGDQKKPTAESLNGIEVLVFDIQDVGARFYTYINTLQYVMEAAAKYKLPLIVLDRPNPHGNYFDGPILDTAERSFVGLQQIPIVHGLTIGEYAKMLNGEFWLSDSIQCNLKVISMLNWDRNKIYSLPIPPSPNLPNDRAIRLYPSVCLFEGTNVSLGRGTDLPFQCYGFPNNPNGIFEFTPHSIPGKAKHPPLENILCKGIDLSTSDLHLPNQRVELKWLVEAWSSYPDRSKFFLPFFDKLAGNHILKQQISAGWSEEKIRTSWEAGLKKYGLIRSKYLMYP